MSYTIKRAVGYGMTWDRFKQFTLIEASTGSISEQLRKRFEALNVEDMTVPKEEGRSGPHGAPHVIERQLLAKTSSLGGKSPEMGRPEDLFALVQNPDNITDVIFFPNMIYAKAWLRSDSTLDYGFERYGRGEDISETRDFTTYIRHGHFPYNKFLTNDLGEVLPYDDYALDAELPDSGIFGALPEEIRWYLTKHHIMSADGIASLRPVLAQWWA